MAEEKDIKPGWQNATKEKGTKGGRPPKQVKAEERITIRVTSFEKLAIAKKGYTFEDFSKAMNSKGIEVKPTINSRGEMQGMRFLHKSSGTDLKASELRKAFGTRNLIDRGVTLLKYLFLQNWLK